MLDLKDLDCLIALARHRHFARAAAQCGLSQPALSMRLRNLEERLGTRIVKRGNRYQGLTADGERILEHARAILGQVRGLEQEVRAARGDVTGALSLGVIPTAAAYAARAARRLRDAHPGIRPRIETATSLEVQQGVDSGRFDAGITYSEGTTRDLLRVEALYEERYALLVPEALATGPGDDISWIDAARLPLILLEPGMQNRRILDRIFTDAGARPEIVAETNGLLAAVVMAVEGVGATVLPEALIANLEGIAGARFLGLRDPVVAKPVSLVTPLRDHAIPLIAALRGVLLPGEAPPDALPRYAPAR